MSCILLFFISHGKLQLFRQLIHFVVHLNRFIITQIVLKIYMAKNSTEIFLRAQFQISKLQSQRVFFFKQVFQTIT